jgi:low temperature requirement protein LtrA
MSDAHLDAPGRHFRVLADGADQRTTNLELFLDLVFVFVITQLAGRLYGRVSWPAAGEAALLLLVVWWGWIYTTWMTNWFDPDLLPVRLTLVGVMLAGLLMGISIPHAFDHDALLFACSYVGMQVMRNSFAAWSANERHTWQLGFLRILLWSVATGAIIITGAALGGRWLLPVWCAGLALDYLGPAAGYWVPRLGRAVASEWQIDGGHFAERVQLFVMISLGEGVAVIGLTAGHEPLTATRILAVAVAFLTSAALWWLYFNFLADRAAERLRAMDRTGAMARDAFTYIHIVIVAGVIATAVADHELVLHPTSISANPVVAVVGPALYLLGITAFRLRMIGSASATRVTGIVVLAALGLVAAHVPLLLAGSLVLLTLVLIIVYERSLPMPAPLLQPE